MNSHLRYRMPTTLSHNQYPCSKQLLWFSGYLGLRVEEGMDCKGTQGNSRVIDVFFTLIVAVVSHVCSSVKNY